MTGVLLHIIGGLEGVVAQGMEGDMTGVPYIRRGLDGVVAQGMEGDMTRVLPDISRGLDGVVG